MKYYHINRSNLESQRYSPNNHEFFLGQTRIRQKFLLNQIHIRQNSKNWIWMDEKKSKWLRSAFLKFTGFTANASCRETFPAFVSAVWNVSKLLNCSIKYQYKFCTKWQGFCGMIPIWNKRFTSKYVFIFYCLGGIIIITRGNVPFFIPVKTK